MYLVSASLLSLSLSASFLPFSSLPTLALLRYISREGGQHGEEESIRKRDLLFSYFLSLVSLDFSRAVFLISAAGFLLHYISHKGR